MGHPGEFSVTVTSDVNVVHLPEELLAPLESANFREQWLTFLDQEQPHHVVVNFDVVRSFGSESVGTLIHGAQRLRRRGGDVRLCSMSDRIREIFDICKLVPTVFHVHKSTGEAIEAFQREP